MVRVEAAFDIDLDPEAPGGLPGKGGAAFNENQPKTDDGFEFRVC